jgi:preprotein translocase subunit SecF
MPDRGRYDIIGKTGLWFTLSGVVIGVGIIFMILNAISPQLNYGRSYPLKLGIDFTGGNVYRLVYDVDFNTEVTDSPALVGEIHSLVDGMSRTIPLVQAGRNEEGKLVIQIRTDETVKDKEKDLKAAVLDVVRSHKAGAELTDEAQDYVGPVIGRELAYRGILGLIVGGLLILVYVGLRMSFDFAVCAIAALFHDVLVLCGVFAIIRVEVDSSFVAAILTVVGYSINDTIVIFDRIRENSGLKKGMAFADMVNLSLVQTLPRSINTSLTTLFPLLCLIFIGGATIKHFALALLVGIISGTYSSIFNASPILVAWRRKKKMRALVAKELAYGAAGGGVSTVKAHTAVPPVARTTGSPEESLEELEAEEPALEYEKAQPKPAFGPGKAGAKKKKKKRKR